MDRIKFWAHFINARQIISVTEIGVWRGEFAEQILARCECIERYHLVDPWRNLDDWDKPFNQSDDYFEEVLAEAKQRVAPFQDKCMFLRGKTTEVTLPKVEFTYIDGDHTLRGIAIDLIRAWPHTDWLGGDDFCAIWQYGDNYEPSLVNPFAAHFAEAIEAPFRVYGDQFLIGGEGGFGYTGDTRLLPHIQPRKQSRSALQRIAQIFR
jgi:hypothetical protein